MSLSIDIGFHLICLRIDILICNIYKKKLWTNYSQSMYLRLRTFTKKKPSMDPVHGPCGPAITSPHVIHLCVAAEMNRASKLKSVMPVFNGHTSF